MLVHLLEFRIDLSISIINTLKIFSLFIQYPKNYLLRESKIFFQFSTRSNKNHNRLIKEPYSYNNLDVFRCSYLKEFFKCYNIIKESKRFLLSYGKIGGKIFLGWWLLTFK